MKATYTKYLIIGVIVLISLTAIVLVTFSFFKRAPTQATISLDRFYSTTPEPRATPTASPTPDPLVPEIFQGMPAYITSIYHMKAIPYITPNARSYRLGDYEFYPTGKLK